MNESHPLDVLRQTPLTAGQQQRLFGLIDDLLQEAITVRAPKNRPPGKAGLRAEKGYYRLLYLADDFRQHVGQPSATDDGDTPYHWSHLDTIIAQLADIPELQAEILAGIASSLARVAGS